MNNIQHTVDNKNTILSPMHKRIQEQIELANATTQEKIKESENECSKTNNSNNNQHCSIKTSGTASDCGSGKGVVIATLRADGKVVAKDSETAKHLANLMHYKIRTESDIINRNRLGNLYKNNANNMTNDSNDNNDNGNSNKSLQTLSVPTTVLDMGKQLLKCARDSDVVGVKALLTREVAFAADWKEVSAAVSSIITDGVQLTENYKTVEERSNPPEKENNYASDTEVSSTNRSISTVNLLKKHGISLQKDDDQSKDLLNTALRNGRQLVLSEGGKMLLNESIKKKINSELLSAEIAQQQIQLERERLNEFKQNYTNNNTYNGSINLSSKIKVNNNINPINKNTVNSLRVLNTNSNITFKRRQTTVSAVTATTITTTTTTTTNPKTNISRAQSINLPRSITVTPCSTDSKLDIKKNVRVISMNEFKQNFLKVNWKPVKVNENANFVQIKNNNNLITKQVKDLSKAPAPVEDSLTVISLHNSESENSDSPATNESEHFVKRKSPSYPENVKKPRSIDIANPKTSSSKTNVRIISMNEFKQNFPKVNWKPMKLHENANLVQIRNNNELITKQTGDVTNAYDIPLKPVKAEDDLSVISLPNSESENSDSPATNENEHFDTPKSPEYSENMLHSINVTNPNSNVSKTVDNANVARNLSKRTTSMPISKPTQTLTLSYATTSKPKISSITPPSTSQFSSNSVPPGSVIPMVSLSSFWRELTDLRRQHNDLKSKFEKEQKEREQLKVKLENEQKEKEDLLIRLSRLEELMYVEEFPVNGVNSDS